MVKRIFPPEGTPLRGFLDAMRSCSMGLHPEFVQAVGNRKLKYYADELRGMGWDVLVTHFPASSQEAPNMHVAFYYLSDAAHALDAAAGDMED